MILALSALFLAGSPPDWVRGAGLGAGSAVAAVAARAGLDIAGRCGVGQAPSGGHGRAYALRRRSRRGPDGTVARAGAGRLRRCSSSPVTGSGRPRDGSLTPGRCWRPRRDPGGTGALAWIALKVGALSFGGGFVIVPLMQADAVGTYHWMTHAQFLNAVALGQITPGPLVQTVAAVGYAAGRPRLRACWRPSWRSPRPSPSSCSGPGDSSGCCATSAALAFLGGAGPAAAGAIIGSAIPLALALRRGVAVPAARGAAALALLVLRAPIVATLLACGAVGVLAALLGAPLLH